MSRSRGSAPHQPRHSARTERVKQEIADAIEQVEADPLPPGFTRDPAQPLRSVETAQDAAEALNEVIQGLLAEGRVQEAAELRERQQQAAATAQQIARIRDLLAKDPAVLVFELLQQIPVVIAQAAEQAVGAAMAQRPRFCADCLGLRHAWNARHAAELDAAKQAIMAATGATSENDPRVAQASLLDYLPAHLQPGQPDGLPLLPPPVTMEGGKDVCPDHHSLGRLSAGAAGMAGRLIGMPAISASAAAAFGRQLAGMPGGVG